MQPLEELEGRYDALRERDRTIASLQSKQRLVSTFEQLLDDDARSNVDSRLWAALDVVRSQARALALELARAVFVELAIDDLARISTQLRRFEAFLDAQPSARLDACGDLLTFLRELRQTAAPLRPRPRLTD
ncbi:hypothetical protein [Paraliomyxa miuraensis]|uniref:hypothetical protein n=1 Tax=Paraliomyxa miuraensis TaxID=376150 RepID=UPI002256F4C8|nr:hypothetical protein [Paraliomyxa miuraensis]MCX4248017.1 hypothetical protein [Paraliomyxa miuraensis]